MAPRIHSNWACSGGALSLRHGGVGRGAGPGVTPRCGPPCWGWKAGLTGVGEGQPRDTELSMFWVRSLLLHEKRPWCRA